MPESRLKTILIFGMPGVGKGTQGELLGRIPGFIHLATGDIFRHLDPASESGQIFQEYSARGELVPDDVTVDIFKHHVEKLIADGSYRPADHLLLLDGVPRSLRQASALDEYIQVIRIVHLIAADEDRMVSRLGRRAASQGRDDDAREEVIRHRFQVYRDETRPVLDFYGTGLIEEVDALGSPAEVLGEILRIVAPVQREHFGNILDK